MNTQTTSSPYEYLGPTLCVRKEFLIGSRIISESDYKNYVKRGHFNVLKSGRGPGATALIEYHTITKPHVKEALVEVAPVDKFAVNPLTPLITPDNEAFHFFVKHKKPDGSRLALQKQRIYSTNAILLNACQEFIRINWRMKKLAAFEKLSLYINELTKTDNNPTGYEFDLPRSPKGLMRKYDQYCEGSYTSLLHGNEGNDNKVKATDKIKDLILSIHAMKNKPFASQVLDYYIQFIEGKIEIVDRLTGELLDPKDYYKNGSPVYLSESTVHNILNEISNRIVLDKKRNDLHYYQNKNEPHHHRGRPNYSLSKISLDDRDLPRKMADGKRVKAYYAYDVKSGAVIGASYSRDKDTKLFLDCIRDMLTFLNERDLGIPMEMEVEHHLVNNFKNDLMKAGTCFPFVRWCNAGNSQEKHAEHFNKAKKYGFEKRYQEGIGRWYAKSEAYRVSTEKIFDGENNNYHFKKHDYEQLVADDRATVQEYNNSLHPDQKSYPNMTRMDVLMNKVNPNVARFDQVVWARYVGKKVDTSIRRTQYVRVANAKYMLSSPRIIEQLEVNNLEVQAYYIENKEGLVDRVFIYQNDEFIDECWKIETYNTATAEHTDADIQAREKQIAFVADYQQMVKENSKKIAKIEFIKPFDYTQIEAPKTEIKPPLNPAETDEFARLLAEHDPNEIRRIAKDKA